MLWFQHSCGAQSNCEDPGSSSGVLHTNPSCMGGVCVHIRAVNKCTGSRDRAGCSELPSLPVLPDDFLTRGTWGWLKGF